VEKDLEEMLERGFWDSGYVDAGRKALVLGAPIEDIPDPEPQPQPETQDTATLTLRRIRQINDAIANPELSEKIYRIEELTGKIFRLLEERPEKTGELRSFMNYYLPQTLKILESYAKLEAQGIDGENIAEAKGKIEAMMDKLVDGYETQLDKLFAEDVLDISADLKVMEQMLEKDGLTVDSGLNL
jgi:5-bromo-4-chloroindolyl phosphate hydrolysis protein